MRPLICCFSLVLAVSLAGSASAVDGVLEINQACAVNTGCFTGDALGLPVTITAAGSYRLTSNLVVPNENTSAILVTTSSVSIDLNGFEIVRSGCEGATTNCTPGSGAGSGIAVDSQLTRRGISAKNGSITGMGRSGVQTGPQSEITNLRVRWNRLIGIHTGGFSTVSGNTAYENGSTGIYSGASTVSGNTVYGTSGIGIDAAGLSVVFGNSSTHNTGDGIAVSDGSTVSGNTVADNGGDGIDAQNGCTVSGNTTYKNTLFGLKLGFSSGYRDNVVLSNGGTITGGVDAGGNVCENNTICP